MPEATQYFFSHQELVTALIKTQGIHDGVWVLSMQFGMGAANVGEKGDGSDLNPAAIVPVLKVGIQKSTDGKLTSIAVDASQVNPAG